MFRKYLAIILVTAMLALTLTGCEGKTPTPTPPDVTLTIAGGWTDCKAIEEIGRLFSAKYPNCTVVYEYIQDYYSSLEKRMTGDEKVDLFFTTNIQTGLDGEAYLPYALDLKGTEGLDLSNTFKGLIDNFSYREDTTKMYAIPVGAVMRGLYVNKTLLESLNITVPTNQAELLAACETLKQNGYIAFHGNPVDFSQRLLYPWICNLIANADDYEAAYNKVEAAEPGLTEFFKEPIEFIYTLVENDYYDYKTAQSPTGLNVFNSTTDEDCARYFLNINKSGDTYVKSDDVGKLAFMPGTMSFNATIEKTKEDYHSEIEYVFIPAPVGKDGGFVYLSPAHGIAANKTSDNVEWSVKFLNFMFEPENNKTFAQTFDVIPNTKDAFSYITSIYNTPSNNISELGQVTFSYDFYGIITKSLAEISKANNPKYMQENADGTKSLYPLSYYTDKLEKSFAEK